MRQGRPLDTAIIKLWFGRKATDAAAHPNAPKTYSERDPLQPSLMKTLERSTFSCLCNYGAVIESLHARTYQKLRDLLVVSTARRQSIHSPNSRDDHQGDL